MKKVLIAGFFILASTIANAQHVTWAAKPSLHAIDAKEKKEPAIIITDERIIEYAIESDKSFHMYKTMHKIIRVNNEKAMEQFNKVYVPVSSRSKLVKVKARSIAPNGTVVEVNENNIKELKDVEDYGNFKIFAIEGLQKGGEVEYTYTLDIEPQESGREVFQSETKIKSGTFKIISPSHIEMQAQGYNGFPVLTVKEGDKRVVSATLANVPAQREEHYTTQDANLMKVDYHIASFTDQSGKKVEGVSWKKIAAFFDKLVAQETTKDAKRVRKLITKDLKLNGLSDEQKIKAIEEYVKSNIMMREGDGPEYSSVYNIITNKYGDELGLTKLYASCFKQLNIPYEVMITSNRYQSRFDEYFATWQNMRHFAFVFPQFDKYLIPTAIEYRLGMAPYMFASNHALMLNRATLHHIPMSDTSINYIRKDIQIQTPSGQDHATLDVKFRWNGHRAFRMRGYYQYSDEKAKETLVKQLLDTDDDGMEIVEKKLVNEKTSNSGDGSDFIIEAKLNSAAMIESAGNNILFNIGKAIGKQTEMYQENERQQNIDMDHPIKYVYNIGFTVPDGYVLKGAEDLNINYSLKEKGGKVAQFKSSYTQFGNQVKVLVEEFYTQSGYNKNSYEDFRKVINAAADFSKVVLVFEKGKNQKKIQ